MSQNVNPRHDDGCRLSANSSSPCLINQRQRESFQAHLRIDKYTHTPPGDDN